MKYTVKQRLTKIEYTILESTIKLQQFEKFGTDYSEEIQLKTLSTKHGEMHQKTPYHFLPVASIGIIIFLISIFFLGTPNGSGNPIFITLILIAASTLIGSYFTGKKIRKIFYRNMENTYIFEISEEKHKKQEFENFIQTLDKKIIESKK